jgi:ABC-type transport system substrate-binding protein
MKLGHAKLVAHAVKALLAVTLLLAIACSAATTPQPSSDSGLAAEESPTTEATPVPVLPSTDRSVELRVGAVADTYQNDANDPSRLTVGMFPTNVNIFDQLVLVDHDFQIQPMLAESWGYDTQMGAWRFHLRNDVVFHDGQPFTAQAIVDIVQRFWSQGAGGDRLRINEASATAIDDFTVDITPVTPHLRISDYRKNWPIPAMESALPVPIL